MKFLRRIEARFLLAMAALGGGLWVVLKLASEVKEGETGAFDRAVLLALRTPDDPHNPIGPNWLQEAARDMTALGGFTVLTLVSVAAVAVLLIYRRREKALVFAVTVVLAQVAAALLKATIDRPRPDLVSHLDLTYSSSFPSGHSVMSPVVYFTLAILISAGEIRRPARILLVGGAAILVVAIGVSRVYLGVHWPTDVLGGWALGSAVALSSWFVLRRVGPGRLASAADRPEDGQASIGKA
ncbi:MAG TPA: phosphatase PAP2 family protein [Caulobacteraceae bacterium]|jgi:undecaprenyl-diphosphatase